MYIQPSGDPIPGGESKWITPAQRIYKLECPQKSPWYIFLEKKTLLFRLQSLHVLSYQI